MIGSGLKEEPVLSRWRKAFVRFVMRFMPAPPACLGPAPQLASARPCGSPWT